MGSKYRTAAGKVIDLDTIRLQNEEVIAVGNMNVNARGDQIGSGGAVVKDRNKRMNEEYRLHSMVPASAPVVTSAKAAAADVRGKKSVLNEPTVMSKPISSPQVKVIDEPQLTPSEILDERPVRGALASALASTGVEKEPEITPKSTTGVRRL